MDCISHRVDAEQNEHPSLDLRIPFQSRLVAGPNLAYVRTDRRMKGRLHLRTLSTTVCGHSSAVPRSFWQCTGQTHFGKAGGGAQLVRYPNLGVQSPNLQRGGGEPIPWDISAAVQKAAPHVILRQSCFGATVRELIAWTLTAEPTTSGTYRQPLRHLY